MALTRTTGPRILPPRILIYGPPGIGKTTAASKARRPVFLPTEDGLALLDVKRIADENTGKLNSWWDLVDATRMAIDEPHAESATIVVDTITSAQDLCFAEVARKHRVFSITDVPYGKGYAPALVLWIEYLKLLEHARARGKAAILLGHSHVERFDDPEGEAYDRYSLRLHQQADGKPSLRLTTMDWADVVAFANLRTTRRTSGSGFDERTIASTATQRVLYTQPSPVRAAKTRYPLPPEMPFDMAVLSQHLGAAFAAATPSQQQQPQQQQSETQATNAATSNTEQAS